MKKVQDVIEVSVMAEEFLLGAILISSSYGDTTAINNVRCIITPQHFSDYGMYVPRRSRIYQAMLDCQQAPHILNVVNYLKNTHRLMKNDISELNRYHSLDIYSFEYMTYARVLKECALELKPELKKQEYKGIEL